MAVVAVLGGCDSEAPTAPHECLPEATRLDGLCWNHLGLDGEWIADIAVTPWGVFAGTQDHGIFRLESSGEWTALGPETWHDRVVPRALLYVPTDPPMLLARPRGGVAAFATLGRVLYAATVTVDRSSDSDGRVIEERDELDDVLSPDAMTRPRGVPGERVQGERKGSRG